jgi:hypothetical protein
VIPALFCLCVSVFICVYLCFSLSGAAHSPAAAVLNPAKARKNTDAHRYAQINTDSTCRPTERRKWSSPRVAAVPMGEVHKQDNRPNRGAMCRPSRGRPGQKGDFFNYGLPASRSRDRRGDKARRRARSSRLAGSGPGVRAVIPALFYLCVSVFICVHLCFSLSGGTGSPAAAALNPAKAKKNTDEHRYAQINTDSSYLPTRRRKWSLPRVAAVPMGEVHKQDIRPDRGAGGSGQREGPSA